MKALQHLIDLVFVRHAQAEGNAAFHRSEKGDDADFTDEFRARHNGVWRLTDKGIDQARLAGTWLRREFPHGFDRYAVSDYTRAMETAAHLALPDAQWTIDFMLRERDIGHMDAQPESIRHAQFADELARREKHAVYWRPVGGESVADVAVRTAVALQNIAATARERVVIVSHGYTIRCGIVLIEQPLIEDFRVSLTGAPSTQRLPNCQIVHYTRRNPVSGKIADQLRWKRIARPAGPPGWTEQWDEIAVPHYTNDDLLSMVGATDRMIAA